MQHLHLQVLNHEAITGYLTLSVTIEDGTAAPAEVMGNINQGFETLRPRLLVQPLDLSFNHLQDTIQNGVKLGVYVAAYKDSAWPKISSEQASANSSFGKMSWEQASTLSRGGTEARVNKNAKHGNRVICQDCGAKVALTPGRKLARTGHGRRELTGELRPRCVSTLAWLARKEVVKL